MHICVKVDSAHFNRPFGGYERASALFRATPVVLCLYLLRIWYTQSAYQ